jgi:hypothetical protein
MNNSTYYISPYPLAVAKYLGNNDLHVSAEASPRTNHRRRCPDSGVSERAQRSLADRN